MIFIIRVYPAHLELDEFARCFAQEQCLFVSVVGVLANVWQETPVKQCFSSLYLEFFQHARRNSLADIYDSIPARVDIASLFKRRLELVLDCFIERDRICNVLIRLEAERSYQRDQWNINWRTGDLSHYRAIRAHYQFKFRPVADY